LLHIRIKCRNLIGRKRVTWY